MGEQALFLRSSSCQPDARLRQLYPGPEVVRGLVPVLEQQRLNVFSVQPPITCHIEHARPTMGDGVDTAPGIAHQGQTDYKLDVLNHRPVGTATAWTIDAGQESLLTLSGWVVDREASGLASSVYINVDGQQDLCAEYGQDRLDVAVFFHRPAYRHSGFAAALPVERLGLGIHLPRLKILSVDRRQYYWSEHTWVVHIR